MSSDSGQSNADMSSYEFWRSQHRPGNPEDIERSKLEVFTDAVCNRFGEEVGQNLNRICWPEVPDRLKNAAGMLIGKLGPVFLTGTKLFKSANEFAKQQELVLPKVMSLFSVVVDGNKIEKKFNSWSEIFVELDQAQGYWFLRCSCSGSDLRFSRNEKSGEAKLEEIPGSKASSAVSFTQDDPDLWTKHEAVRKFVKRQLAGKMIDVLRLDVDQDLSALNPAEKKQVADLVTFMKLLEAEDG